MSESAGRIVIFSGPSGVGKTTVAVNLAVYFRAFREELPVLIVGFDDQQLIDQMFAFDSDLPGEAVASAMRMGSFASAI